MQSMSTLPTALYQLFPFTLINPVDQIQPQQQMFHQILWKLDHLLLMYRYILEDWESICIFKFSELYKQPFTSLSIDSDH